MEDKINVEIKGVIREFDKGVTLLTISQEYKDQYENDIMLAMVNNKLRELHEKLDSNCKLEFLTTKDTNGHKTYIRGMILLMLKAMYHEIGRSKIEKIGVEYAIGSGIYCTLEGECKLTQPILDQVKNRMQEMVEADLPICKMTIGTDEAVKLFGDLGMTDKEQLFGYRRVSKTNIYDLDGFKDYFYGYMPVSTGSLKYFDLFLHKDGFILQLPKMITPKVLNVYKPSPKLFDTMHATNEWGKMIEIDTVGALNNAISTGNVNELILVQEAFQEKQIAKIAEQIVNEKDKKFIMIAGPSSSGKTTFSHRLSIQLRTFGLKPHPIALDDYFVNRDQTPRDENGEYNFECLEAIDVKQFNQDMIDLLNGKTVELPTYNFKLGKREYRGNYKTLGPDDVLVIEGIHGLNDQLSYALPKESKFKIYISALTQLNIDEHNRIPTTDGRLIRRMVRDARTRGTSAQSTIRMWPSVRRGEERYIFPFQEQADVMFNSAMIYELAMLKQYAEPILFHIPKDSAEYVEAKRLLKFLDYFITVSSEEVPHNSILREFVGGSCFNV
ncbi:uridine kinase [Lachnospiraceae bacterium KM106-2]|nr:uridine kinase [Lachnospiraceae bacterium KM106-2]